jgi:hypothetical protein
MFSMRHDIAGTWYNQHGSRLTLRASDGRLSGTFASSVGLKKRDGRDADVVGCHAPSPPAASE